MKLTIEHLAPYLPYGLSGLAKMPPHYTDFKIKCDLFWLTQKRISIQCFDTIGNKWDGIDSVNYEQFKPILRPLSDLTKEIEHNGERFVPVEEIKQFFPAGWYLGFEIEIDSLGVAGLRTPESWLPIGNWPRLFKMLYRWHFDVEGLIEKGLAIDINTIHLAKSKNKHLD